MAPLLLLLLLAAVLAQALRRQGGEHRPGDDGHGPQELRPGAVVALGVLTGLAVLVLATASAAAVVNGYVFAAVWPLLDPDAAPITVELDWRLLTAFWRMPKVVGALVALGLAAGVVVAVGRRPVPSAEVLGEEVQR